MRKPRFCICENKDADQLRGNREADQRLCFPTLIVRSLYFLNPKFEASSHILWVYSLVCVGPGRKPERWFSHERGSFVFFQIYNKYLELQYNTKSDEVKKRSSMLSKDRSKHFGHLVEALNLRSNFEIQLHNQTSNSTGSSPLSGQVEAFTPELDDSLLSITTTESPTTALQTGSPMTTPPSGMLGSNGLLFNLAIPPRANDRSTGPLLESML